MAPPQPQPRPQPPGQDQAPGTTIKVEGGTRTSLPTDTSHIRR
jgi:hypothetical protein